MCIRDSYQVGNFPSWKRWSEWNGKYRDDLRDFLKGGYWKAPEAALRISGSSDLYNPFERGTNASINFITCHDGFSLYDLYSYNHKHNEANGWNNTDGSDDNRSWNCGAEGNTKDPLILKLRYRIIKNAFAVLMCSRGTVSYTHLCKRKAPNLRLTPQKIQSFLPSHIYAANFLNVFSKLSFCPPY